MHVARDTFMATLLKDGKVLIAGGDTAEITFTNSAELYDPNTGTWSVTGSLKETLDTGTATLLNNGMVLVAGGETTNSTYSGIADAELYNPATGTWSYTGKLNYGRRLHTATLLQNGQVLVAGGGNSNYSICCVAQAELYTPQTGTWSVTGSMVDLRADAAASRLNDGRVLVAGGTFTNSAEIYNPSTGTWTATPPMNIVHGANGSDSLVDAFSALLSNGNVLVPGNETDGAELFIP